VSEFTVSAAVRRQVRARAAGRCEYCLLAEADAYFPHEADHIIAVKHGGTSTFENSAVVFCHSWRLYDTLRPYSALL
jgi:hypothetical protein